MNIPLQEKFEDLLYRYTNKRNIPPESAINADLHIQGDDAVDFLSEFATIFEVDITLFPFEEYFYNEGELSYLWLLRIFKRSSKKPLLISHLLQAIQSKKLP
jgi:hypothetical protein